MVVNMKDITRNVMAREKALYVGHTVAAVAATSEDIAERALALIDVKYEVLPHVLEVEDAERSDAPVLHDDMMTIGIEPAPTTASNVAKRVEFGFGDVGKRVLRGRSNNREGIYNTTSPPRIHRTACLSSQRL
jgi:CO/xanthine dehydrogenase Mo-binding subunit